MSYIMDLIGKMQGGRLRDSLGVFCKNQENITPAKLAEILEGNENPDKVLQFFLQILCVNQPHLVTQARTTATRALLLK